MKRRAALAFLGSALLARQALAQGRTITDSAGRKVALPDKVNRVFVAGPPASVLAYVLARDAMVGWVRLSVSGAAGTRVRLRFAERLNPDGSLKLTWKCPNPPSAPGTIYQIARRIGTGAFSALTSVGTRSLTDTTVPAGTASVTYRITAVRSTTTGLAAEFIVNFGTGASGEMVASVEETSAPRLAA